VWAAEALDRGPAMYTEAVRLLFLLAAIPAFAGTAADLAAEIRATGLDPNACYRVRDVPFARQDLRFYFTDGYFIFGKPVAGRRVSAIFTADVEGGDAEVIVLPPTRDERLSLARFTRSPNLNERLQAAYFLFTDDTAAELEKIFRQRGFETSPEYGHLVAGAWDPVARNLSESFLVRMIEELIGPAHRPEMGFFYAAVRGRELGNFDMIYDPAVREQIFLGQLVFRDNRAFFDNWASFPARDWRNGRRRPPEPDLALDNFRIEATLDAALQMTARARVQATPRGPTRVLSFEISPRMRIGEVRVNGAPAEVFQRESLRANLLRSADNGTFLVIAPEALEAGKPAEVSFEYAGDPVVEAGKGVYYVGPRGSWYPRRGLQFARYDVTFTYPANLQLLFPGEVVEERLEGATRTVRRSTSEPIRVAGFNLGDFESTRTERAGYLVEVYANRRVEEALQPRNRDVAVLPPPPMPSPGGARRAQTRPGDLIVFPPPPAPDPTARLAGLGREVADAFEFMTNNFGPPSVKTLMVSPIPGVFGQGFPGIVYLSTLAYLDPGARPAGVRTQAHHLFFSELLHAHETAHQWWGNVVGSTSYQDDWLMEGLANYSALMMLERRKGARALSAVLESYKGRLLEKDSDGQTRESTGPIRWGLRLRSSHSPDAWRVVIYEKGSWIIHMLRRRLGDEAFLKMLGEVTRRYRYRAIDTASFLALASEFVPSGQPDPKLEAFAENWIQATGIPSLRVAHSVKGKAPKMELTVTITQSDVADEFTAVAPVQVRFRGAPPLTRWVRTASEAVSFTLAVRQAPSRVLLDPDNSVLAVKP
jgi:hypothetical protein